MLCLPLVKGHFYQKTDGKMRFKFVVLFLLHLHEIVSLKPYITEMKMLGETHALK